MVMHYEQLLQKLQDLYPGLPTAVSLRQRLSRNLVSDGKVELPPGVFEEAQLACSAFFELRQNKKYQDSVAQKLVGGQSSALLEHGNFSALMSYDFHLTPDNQLKLIEINTNASSSLLIDLIYRERGLSNPYSADFRKDIVATFEQEFALSRTSKNKTLQTIAIIDHQPHTQKMYIEFELYKSLFEQAGLKCIIGDIADFKIQNKNLVGPQGDVIDIVYNRYTDFYLSSPESALLLEAYDKNYSCFSPNPREYALLADKERLLEISIPGRLESFGLSQGSCAAIDRVLLKSYDANLLDRNELWSKRRQFFFKPKRSYGGKAAYKGASISKVTFEKMFEAEVLAQEFVAAPVVEIQVPCEGQKGYEPKLFKYDLRFYAYQNRVQLVAARLYQGQTTNMNTLGGGFAPLVHTRT
jgi:hypothetical protein